jgi:hypothetical protein
MKKLLAIAALLVAAGCGSHNAVLPLSSICRPTGGMLDSEVSVRGFIFFHSEEILLCPERSYASAPFVELGIGALYHTPSGFENREARQSEFLRLAERYEAKDVVVHGILRVGPYGIMQRPMVFIEVNRIEEANQAAGRMPGSNAPGENGRH